MPELLAQIAPVLAERKTRFILVTMAAGMTIADIRALAGGEYPVIRIMPNTPAAVGEGMILYSIGSGVTKTEEKEFLADLAAAGRLTALPEALIDAGSAVSGCGPAFADLFLEALADGGVACGLPRAKAQELAAQMLLGSARLALESGANPGALKDAVCSPGGTTIQGVRTLEEAGFRGAVMDAVIAAYEKTLDLKK
jgi:pyrroline-5-carboxylate reductase